MKLLLDMNIPQAWVPFLEEAGYEAVHWRKIGDIRAEDSEIMTWARLHDYVVFTHDLDFGALLYATNASKPSVIQVRSQDIMPSTIGKILIETLQAVSVELMSGALVTVDPKRRRIRLLPLKNE